MTTTRRRENEEEEQTPKKPKNTQRSQHQEKDRISQLPDDILHPVLSLINLKEACITTALSKRWRNLFPSLPRLHFDEVSFGHVVGIGRWLEWVHKILESRRASVRICSIRSSHFHRHHKDFDNIICFLCNYGIQELTIDNTARQHYTVPSCLYFSRTPTRIELRKCLLKVPSKFIILKLLKELNIGECIVKDGDVQRLISGCLALERLTLQHCHKLRNLAVDSYNLAVLDVTTHMQLAVSIVNAPRLETLTLRFRYSQSETYHMLEEDSEDSSEADDEGNDTDESEVSRLVRLLKSLRDVRNLSLEFDGKYMKILKEEGVVAIPVTLRSLLPKMKKLTLKMQANSTYMVSIVSCLLNSCPNLEDLVFGDNNYIWHDENARYVEASMLDYWDQHVPSDCMTNTLSKVTLCLDFGYCWKYWIEPVKFLLNNARVLKNFVIDCRCSVRSILEDLQMDLLLVQPASPDVVVELKIGRRQMFEVV